jgi:hypothetical protein
MKGAKYSEIEARVKQYSFSDANAAKMTRTSTGLPRLEPESSASANSAMAANEAGDFISNPHFLKRDKSDRLKGKVEFVYVSKRKYYPSQ